MSDTAKAAEKRAIHPQVETLRTSIREREERIKTAKGADKDNQEIVLNNEKQALADLTK